MNGGGLGKDGHTGGGWNTYVGLKETLESWNRRERVIVGGWIYVDMA